MIEQISWLHISDLHLKADIDTWSQNVVLREFLDDVGRRIAEGSKPEFVIVSGDLAFSGKKAEYLHVMALLDELLDVLELPRQRIVISPGNHDVDLSVQRTCHHGARQLLSSPQAVEEFLGDDTEREALLERLAAYRAFEAEYVQLVSRQVTVDGLASVTQLDLDGLPIAIISLNSAWLCQGGEAEKN